jgi:UDP:flavonoid glycosyltransferase YjiC (YdhE family)
MGARVMFTTTPGRGHYQSMLPLASAFRERGHELRWVAAADVCERLRGKGFDAVSAGLPEGETSVDLPRLYPEIMALPPARRPEFLFAKIFGPARAGPMLEDLLPAVREWEPGLIVTEQAELATPIAATLAGVPWLTHSFGRLLPRERVERAGEEMAALWEAHGLEVRPFAGTYDHLYLDIYPPSLQAAEIDHLAATQPLQPVAPVAREPDAEPLVYITFGTVWNRDATLIARVVEGARQLPVRVVVTVGPGQDTAALGEQPGNVEVAEFIPQADLLPRCAAVVSHAGSGTFLAALAAGLPQLFLPQAADQFLNAEAGARGCTGIAIPPDTLSAERVRDELNRLLTDASFGVAAGRVGEEIAAMPPPAAVVEAIEARFSL